MRKEGRTYSEILAKVPVAKSTLSIWLRDVGLSRAQKHSISQKKRDGAFRGALSRKNFRIKHANNIKKVAASQVGRLTTRDKWLIGIALYWAEGSKEKQYAPGSPLIFNNSDPQMVTFYVDWLLHSVRVEYKDIHLSLYIHESKRAEISDTIDFWTKTLGFPKGAVKNIYFKRHKITTTRKNVGDLYRGTMRVTVKRSADLNRKVAGWVEGIVGA